MVPYSHIVFVVVVVCWRDMEYVENILNIKKMADGKNGQRKGQGKNIANS